jgi:putative nucleotidyltransferase with HDIG domain
MIATHSQYDRLRSNRDEIVWRIITNGVLPEQRNLAVDVVADAFFDRLFEALERGSYLDVIAWVDRTCAAYAEFPQIGSMLAGSCRAVIASLTEDAGRPSELVAELCALEQSITGVAFKARSPRTKANVPLDDIDSVIHELLEKLEAADPLTSEHSHAVSAWCGRIGRRLSLSETEVTYVARCGLVHDLGKMHTPPDVLGAPRSLTESEWVLMRAHSSAGEEIVRSYKPLRHLAPAVRSHHERLDGTGYPDGLVGSQITLATRIVTVADAFNAMIGRRPYRLPMSPMEAIDRLAEGRGKQFDPIVVEAMIDAVQHSAAKAPKAEPV